MSRSLSPVLVGSLLAVFSLSVTPAHAEWLINDSGILVQVDGSVLGQARQKLEAAPATMEQVRSRLEVKEGNAIQVRQAVMNQEGEVIRRKELDFEPGEGLRLERPDGRGINIDIDDQGRFEFREDRFKAKTSLPLSVDENNELIVTRLDGTEKAITLLPDTAADKLRESGLAVFGDEVGLEVAGEAPVYRFHTQQEKRFLGLFKRSYNQETTVSAETGEIVNSTSTETSFIRTLLERLSF